MHRVSGRALLLAVVALALMVFAVPSHVAAQPNATVAAAGTPSGGQAATGPAAKDEGNDQFLHSSVVQSLARVLHLKLDTAVTLLLGINFAIIFFAIVIPLTRTMPRVMRKRSETLNHELANARQATAEAQARLKAVEAQLAGLDAEIKKLAAQVEEESREDEKRIKSAMGEESARIVAAAEQEINQAITQAKRGLRSFAADLAIGHAEQQIALTPETDRALIAEFVARAGGDGKGGRN